MKKICLAVALAAVLTLGVSAARAADATTAANAAPGATEKCYGVAKAGKDVAIELPAGVCEKLANGTVTPPAATPEKK
jgi:uncharacterized membrane protein